VNNNLSQRRAVLVVEDDLAIRRLVRMVLERHGYRVDVASDGAEAESRIQSSKYDAIILDLMMPRLDGFAFLVHLQQEDPERLKRIIVTSAASPALIQERLHVVPFDMVPKPFDISDLADRVRACLNAQTE
jgi:DNA-binding response OmpR family regulator